MLNLSFHRSSKTISSCLGMFRKSMKLSKCWEITPVKKFSANSNPKYMYPSEEDALLTEPKLNLPTNIERCCPLLQQEKYLAQANISSESLSEKMVSVDGFNLKVLESGKGSHNVLCLPGILGTAKFHFGNIFNAMDKSKFRLISWDPPGYGKSRPRRSHKGDYCHRDAIIAANLMDKLGYDKYSILGWSNGGQTGCNIATAFPQKVTKLAIWGTQAFYNQDVLVRILALTDVKYWSEELRYKIYEKEILTNMLEDYFKSLKKWHESGGDKVFQTRISKIQCPTLILQGTKDTLVTMDQARYFLSHVSDSNLHVIEGGRHNLHITHTSDFVRIVEDFLHGC